VALLVACRCQAIDASKRKTMQADASIARRASLYFDSMATGTGDLDARKPSKG
jgi:hypothetical protein